MAEHIQVGDISPRAQYSGDGTRTAFPYPFPIFADDDIEVYEDTSLKTLTIDYTVSDAGQSSGGEVTFGTAPAASAIVTLRRNVTIERTSDFQQSGEFRAKVINDELDRMTAEIQQVDEIVSRSLRLKAFDADGDMELPDRATRANQVLGFDVNGDPVASTTSLANFESSAADAAISAAAALVSELATAADAGATNADAAAAELSRIDAAASAAMAATAADGVIYNNVTYITNADSPYTLTSGQDGELLAADTSSGSITINLPPIASGGDGWRISIKKTTGDGNTITMSPDGSDTVDGSANAAISTANSGATYVADSGKTPDDWTSVGFGAAAGNMVAETFSGTGAQTAFTLSVDPGSLNNVSVFISGVRQVPTTDYSVSGTMLTFVTAPASGTGNIFALSGTTLSIGTPADATVSGAKIALGADASGDLLYHNGSSYVRLPKGTDGQLLSLTSGVPAWVVASGSPSGTVIWYAANSAPTDYLECDGAAVSRTTYAGLFAAISTTFGVGDGSTTFNIPDLRGEFIRGWDNGKGTDSGRAFGSSQTDDFESHEHYAAGNAGGGVGGGVGNSGSAIYLSSATGGDETRPRNIALMACIKT